MRREPTKNGIPIRCPKCGEFGRMIDEVGPQEYECKVCACAFNLAEHESEEDDDRE